MSTSEGITYELLIRSALRYEVKINVPADGTSYCMNQAIYELGKEAEIPGFRKGRASPEGVRAHYGKSRVREVAADILAHDAFSKIVGSLKNKPVTPPEFGSLNSFQVKITPSKLPIMSNHPAMVSCLRRRQRRFCPATATRNKLRSRVYLRTRT